MNKYVIWAGALLITAVLLGIPVLLAISFLCNWSGFFKFVFLIMTVIDFFGVADVVATDTGV